MFNWYIPGVYLTYDIVKGSRYILGINSNVTDTETTHKVWGIVKTVIRHSSSYDMFKTVIY
jgi:hypothetical protein